MGSYLEGYGEAQGRRAKTLKWLVLTAAVLLIASGFAYFQFRDYTEERKVRVFLQHLRDKDYKAAYALWGCTDANPCSQYPYEEFMKDWGPASPYSAAERAHVSGMKSCDSGIIQWVRFPAQPDVLLWVDRETETLSFAPWRIKSVPGDFRHRLAAWMWDITRNCKPLIEP
jgi:hypothetical protein